MEEMSMGFLVAFLLPFHVAGGAALGIGLQRILKDGLKPPNRATNLFLLLWGAMFGGIPLMLGLAMGPAWLILAQFIVFVGTVVGVALAYEWLRDLYRNPGMFLASGGLVFFLLGVALATSLLSNGDPSGLLFGLIFGGVGGILLLVGVWLMLRGP